jgi:hypothetical protein
MDRTGLYAQTKEYGIYTQQRPIGKAILNLLTCPEVANGSPHTNVLKTFKLYYLLRLQDYIYSIISQLS